MVPVSQRTAGDSGHPSGPAPALVDDLPIARVLVAGELDLHTAPRLDRFLNRLLADGYRQVDLDLSQLRFLAAAGLTVFCTASARFRQVGGQLRLTTVPPRIRRVLQITNLDGVLELPVGEPGAGVAACSARVAPGRTTA
jgi:anti-sigma B factor antagonist